MCGKRSCYKGKYLVIGVEGFEVGCFLVADPSDSRHGLKAFSGGLSKILLVLLSSRRRRRRRSNTRTTGKKQEMRLIFKYGTVGPTGLNQDFSFT